MFEDQIFNIGTFCGYCNNKIWMKAGRQCRDCLITVHKKCEDKFNIENICTHEPVRPISSISEDDNASLSTDDTDSRTTTTPHLSKAVDSVVRRSFRGLRKKIVNQTSTTSLQEFPKSDDSDTNLSLSQSSSKLVSAASLAYSRFRDFKNKRTSLNDLRRTRIASDSSMYFEILFHYYIFLW